MDSVAVAARQRKKIVFVAAPDGQAGGGMGRVKDYILQIQRENILPFQIVPLVTRNEKGKLFSVLLMLAAVLKIALAALRGRAALVHVHMGDRGSIPRKAVLLFCARLFAVPALLHLHAVELDRHYRAAGSFLRRLIRLPFGAASVIVVLGERFRDWLVAELDVPPGRIEILYNGVDLAAPPPAREFAGERPQRILFLGNLLERKGLSDFLAALADLPADAPRWRAVVAGGGDVAHYQGLAGKLAIDNRVDFAGWVDQAGVRAALVEADMLVLPSYEEGLPLVILEALGSGLPVVCTPVGVIAEVLADGETALFSPVGDHRALAGRIGLLLGDRALQRRLSRQGLALFRSHFSLSAFGNNLFRIYRDRAGVGEGGLPVAAAVARDAGAAG